MAQKDTIYIKPVGGLCNRMRAIDSCVSLAKRCNKQVVVFWGRDTFLNCGFSDLFEPSEYYEVIEEKQWLGKKVPYPYLPGSCPTSAVKKALFKVTKAALSIKTEIWFEDLDQVLDVLRPKAEAGALINMQTFEEQAYPLFAPVVSRISNTRNVFICSAWRLVPEQSYKTRFTPVKPLRDKIAAVTKQFGNTTGVHIRRSDHDLSIRHSSFDKFQQAVYAELGGDKNRTIFLATDSKETESALKQLFPNRIISFAKSSYNRAATQGIQDALVDLYCLSHTQKIFGSYFSSFSQVAAAISGIEEYTVN